MHHPQLVVATAVRWTRASVSRAQLSASAAAEAAAGQHDAETATAHAVDDEVRGGVERHQDVADAREMTPADDERPER